jgi:gliding motility associated protien GldN
MRQIIFKSLVICMGCLGLANAQSKYKTGNAAKQPATKPATTPAAAPATTQQKPATATQQKTGTSRYLNNNANANNAAANAASATTTNDPVSTTPASTANVTVRYDTTIAGAFDGKVEQSLRNNYAVERNLIKDRKPLEYDYIREDDQFWSQFVWEEIDAREKINQSFIYPGKDDNGDQRFFSILLSAIKNDSVVAFSPDNDMFRTPLTADQVNNLTAGSLDTVDVADPISGTVEKVITRRPKFSPDSVYTFRLKEQWIFDKESSRMYCRIIGIAPIAKQVVGGKSQPRTLFWVHYPDLRRTLVKFDVYNPKNFAGRMSWEELFESRFFSSYIIKSTINNPGDKYLNALIKDPLFRLLEGQNIKDKIFNYEQDLWSY